MASLSRPVHAQAKAPQLPTIDVGDNETDGAEVTGTKSAMLEFVKTL
jgi:hypothetical protein